MTNFSFPAIAKFCATCPKNIDVSKICFEARITNGKHCFCGEIVILGDVAGEQLVGTFTYLKAQNFSAHESRQFEIGIGALKQGQVVLVRFFCADQHGTPVQAQDAQFIEASNFVIMENNRVGSKCIATTMVQFTMIINSLAPSYASMPISKGKLSAQLAQDWQFAFYLYGHDSDNLNAKLQVCASNQTQFLPASGLSQALSCNVPYFVKWTYDEKSGGTLHIVGPNLSEAYHTPSIGTIPEKDVPVNIGKVIYNGGGRYHSDFDGQVLQLQIQ